ncbi:MAG: N-acetyl sugar amidotransferase [Bacteroidetes bacterium]|nr:MAG: N-acetyl sugar amidotransferase [Bacteroidota bacterium]MBL1145613.1 N-acetyl sugar amidotransferase [Bacteroidota bacterium]NOG58409.1 N-acetyl sugar amidotransferase [Bacteroidota bacterium]
MESIGQECTFCVMDQSDPKIQFDTNGECNHCKSLRKELKELLPLEKRREQLNKLVQKIKETSTKNEYDCVIGLSGGVDSSYLAYLVVKELKLKPLAVHLDNGWNSELAVQNIEQITSKLNIDLFTYVVDWDEFRSIQLAYLKASVIDIEVVSDQAIRNTLLKQALKFKIPYILSGNNIRTEGILPKEWYYNKSDQINLRAINKKFGTQKLNTYPQLTDWEQIKVRKMKKVDRLNILEYIDFNKDDAKQLIINELGWRDYGGKHYESIFTRFYQGYILVNKFKIDKRRAHLSSLIASGQMSRPEAIMELKSSPYPSETMERDDYDFVLKKLGLKLEEFEKIMEKPIVRHDTFKIDQGLKKKYFG